MEEINEKIIDILVCPRCFNKLERKENLLVCHKCELAFPIKDGIPNMLIHKAAKYYEGVNG